MMKSENVKITLKDEGYDVYAPGKGQTWGYRYGPSIMTYDKLRADAWFASPGAAGEADWFTYRHTDDGGKTWSDEVVVLTPTADSMDFFSVCDPGVIRFGGWYYIGYTSTVFVEGGGVCNNAFVARSRKPDGPFEKWSGGNWGEQRRTENEVCSWMGKPAPIIYFDGVRTDWGIGELSFVVLKNILYIYYTLTTKAADGTSIRQTRVATADATREDWPMTVKQRGIAASRASGSHDSFDVVYSEDYNKFIAISTDKRFTKDSMLAIYESSDGLEFERVCELRTNTGFMCHNSGISGDEYHHIKKDDLLLLGYAYGDKWGFWGTRFHEYGVSPIEGNYSEAELPNVQRPVIPAPECPARSMALTTLPHFYRCTPGVDTEIKLISLNSAYISTEIGADEATFDNYDTSVISIEGMSIKPVGVGYTFVTAHALGRTVEFLVYVYPEGFDFSPGNRYTVSYEPVTERYTLSLRDNTRVQIRGIAQYSNGDWKETGDADDGVSYSDYKDSLISITENGVVTAKGKKGSTDVTVSLNGLSFTCEIKVIK